MKAFAIEGPDGVIIHHCIALSESHAWNAIIFEQASPSENKYGIPTDEMAGRQAQTEANGYRCVEVNVVKVESAQPVAWYDPTNHHVSTDKDDPLFTPLGQLWPLAVQREWVGLTGPEVDEAYRSVSDREWAIGGLTDARVFFCAIEAKLKEKNGG